MNKSALVIILIALFGVLGILMILGGKPVSIPAAGIATVNVAAIKTSATEVDNLNSDAVLFEQDSLADNELNEILNEAGEMTDETAVSGAGAGSTIETGDVDALAQDLSGLSGDEVINRDLDSALGEAAL